VTTRLFVAIWPSDAARDALAHTVDAARTSAPDVHWQPPERWHITLAFLGPGDPARASARIAERVRDDRQSVAEPISLRRSGAFGPVIWVGVEHGSWLAELARGLQQSLRVADRRFRAHVTVGRVRGADGPARAEEAVASLAEHDGPAWTPGEITLVESVTGPAPAYRVLARWPLSPAAALHPVTTANRDTDAGAVPDSGAPTLEEP
jgi:2'-5' RNA ligase